MLCMLRDKGPSTSVTCLKRVSSSKSLSELIFSSQIHDVLSLHYTKQKRFVQKTFDRKRLLCLHALVHRQVPTPACIPRP